MASVPPVEAPIASTAPGGSTVAASRGGGDGAASCEPPAGSGRRIRAACGGADFLREILAQFSHRVRPARFGQNFDGAEFQRLQGSRARRLGKAADDDGRQRMEMHQFFQKGQAIHAGHFDVQRQHVGA